MIPTKLKTYGEFLHGEYWMRPLARDLHINDRTVRRWAKGDYAMPDRIEGEVIRLCAAHYIKLKLMDAEMPRVPDGVRQAAKGLLKTLQPD